MANPKSSKKENEVGRYQTVPLYGEIFGLNKTIKWTPNNIKCIFHNKKGLNDDVVCCGDEHPTKTAVENPTPCELGYIFE